MSEAPANPQNGWLDSARMPFAAALAHCRSGALQEGYTICQQILAQEPADVDALHLSGLILCQAGNVGVGIERLQRAASLNGRIPVLHYNLAEALRGSGDVGAAAAHYENALRLTPTGFADAQAGLGNCLLRQNKFVEAMAVLRQAVALDPTHAAAHDNLGSALQARGELPAAEASFRQAIVLDPNFIEALYHRGNTLLSLRRFDDAIASFDRALALQPDLAAALHNRGAALLELKRYDEALDSFDRTLQLAPRDARALANRGNVLLQLGRPADAIVSYDRALSVSPNFVDAIYNRGNALMKLGRHGEAIEGFGRALMLKPDLYEALYNRGTALLDLDRYDEAIANFTALLDHDPEHPYARGNLLFARLFACDWTGYAEQVDRISREVSEGKRAAAPFTFLNIPGLPNGQLTCATLYCAAEHPPAPTPLWRGERYPHDRIRVAYLSADLRHHAVGYSFVHLFEEHDRARYETIGVGFGAPPQDAFGERLKGSFERFVDVRDRGDREVAAMLKAWQVDIAVDLMGYTKGSRPGIFALRPAPIQVNFFGFPGTMGADYADYIIADRTVIPEDEQPAYRERIAYLPDTYWPTDSKRAIGETTPTRREAGLPETGFVFCAFNNADKTTPAMFDVWMRLLREVEGSVLWLLGGNEAAERNRRDYARERGVDPDRLVFAPRMSQEHHLVRHRLAGLFLDTLPYNAHTTAVDALWAGLPVVSCPGSTFVGRVAASVLRASGLPELVTESIADYEALALRLARDPEALAAVKAKLEGNRTTHPLFDTVRYTRHLEAAYEAMHRRYQSGEPPATFVVPAPAG